jgi:hypothetical protein
MQVIIKLVSNMLFSGSSCWSRKAGVLCSHPETMRDMRGNHARQSIVKRDKENSSPRLVTGRIWEARSGLENSLDLSMT